LQRAYQRDPEAIEQWQREQFPAIAKQAKASDGEVYFWDGSGFRADTVHGKTWGKKGQTPVVERPGRRQSISAASAVNARSGFWYCTYQGGLNAELFVTLLRKMMRHRSKPVHLVVDGLPAHKTALVKAYVASTHVRFWPLSRSGVFGAFFQLLAETSRPLIWCRCSTAPWCGHMSRLLAQKG
jgi:hypothetical protein